MADARRVPACSYGYRMDHFEKIRKKEARAPKKQSAMARKVRLWGRPLLRSAPGGWGLRVRRARDADATAARRPAPRS